MKTILSCTLIIISYHLFSQQIVILPKIDTTNSSISNRINELEYRNERFHKQALIGSCILIYPNLILGTVSVLSRNNNNIDEKITTTLTISSMIISSVGLYIFLDSPQRLNKQKKLY